MVERSQFRKGRGFPLPPRVKKVIAPSESGEIVPVEPSKFITKKGLNVISFDLTTALDSFEVQGAGTMFWFAAAVSGGAPINTPRIEISFDQSTAMGVPFYPGTKIGGVPYERFFITSAAQAGVTIDIVLATELLDDRVDVTT